MHHADRRFQFEVIEPMQSLLTALARNAYVDPAYSKLHALANSAATSLYHFAERRHGTSPWIKPGEEELRQKVMDVADTAKHGQLRKIERIVSMNQGLVFVFDPLGRVRFDAAVLLATNGRHGEFDVSETLLAFTRILADREGLTITTERNPVDRPFQWAAVSFVPPGELPATSLRLLTKRLEEDGTATLADPVNLTFALLEGEPPEDARVVLRTAPR